MGANTNIDTLRRQHKQLLVERALNIFAPTYKDSQKQKDFWVERLLQGHSVEDFISQLQSNQSQEETEDSSREAPNSETIGKLRIIDENLNLHAGLKRKLLIRLKNYTEKPFETTPEEPVFVAYHWYRANGDIYELDGVRTPLPSPLNPNQKLEMQMNLTPPAEPGEYQLMATMVHEGRCWMEDIGLDVQRFNMTVQDYDGRGLSRHAFSIFKQLHAAEQEVLH